MPLFADLEEAKLQRFALTGAPAVLAVDYPHGPCASTAACPPTARRRPLSRDQITLGTQLARQDRLLIARRRPCTGSCASLPNAGFGYRIGFTGDEDISGRFGASSPPGPARPLLGFQPARNPRRQPLARLRPPLHQRLRPRLRRRRT